MDVIKKISLTKNWNKKLRIKAYEPIKNISNSALFKVYDENLYISFNAETVVDAENKAWVQYQKEIKCIHNYNT